MYGDEAMGLSGKDTMSRACAIRPDALTLGKERGQGDINRMSKVDFWLGKKTRARLKPESARPLRDVHRAMEWGLFRMPAACDFPEWKQMGGRRMQHRGVLLFGGDG